MSRIQSRSPTEFEARAVANWDYFDVRCDACGGFVPEAEPIIHDPWLKFDGGRRGKRVYCSSYCYHWDNETEYWRRGERDFCVRGYMDE